MKSRWAHRIRHAPPLEWAAAILVLLILGILAGVLFSSRRPPPPIVASEFPLRFIGVRPDCGDDIYDAAGRHVRREIYGLPDLKPWPTNTMRRNFVFEIAATNLGQVIPRFRYQLPRKPPTKSMIHLAQTYPLPDGTVRIEIPVDLFAGYSRPFLYFFHRREDLIRLDCRLEVYAENARTHRISLSGPFAGPRATVLSDGTKLDLRFDALGNPAGMEITFTLTPPTNRVVRSSHDVILVRNRKGETLPAGHRRIATQGDARLVILRFPEMTPADIREIVIPQAQSIELRDVRVAYPDLPDRHVPASLEQAAAVLDLPTTAPSLLRLGAHRYERRTLLELLECVRGPHIPQLQSLIMPELADGLASWTDEEAGRLRATARHWAQAPHPKTRLAGVEIGLKIGWEEFIAPAMALLRLPEMNIRKQAASLLRGTAGRLSPDHLREMEALILSSSDPSAVGALAGCLAAQESTDAQAALRRLAADPRPWIWWPVIRACPEDGWWTIQDLPENALKHLILVRGAPPPTPSELIQEAHAELPSMLTVDLRIRHPHIFMFLLKDRVRIPPMDKTRATRWVVDHLRNYPWPDREAFISWTLIQRLNEWHGTNFGDAYAPSDTRRLPALETVPWSELVAEVSAWYDGTFP